jgi:hypothetical protein
MRKFSTQLAWLLWRQRVGLVVAAPPREPGDPCCRRTSVAALIDEYRRATAAALRYRELAASSAVELRALGLRRDGIARRIFDEFYAQGD